jgi:hypothetical protein
MALTELVKVVGKPVGKLHGSTCAGAYICASRIVVSASRLQIAHADTIFSLATWLSKNAFGYFGFVRVHYKFIASSRHGTLAGASAVLSIIGFSGVISVIFGCICPIDLVVVHAIMVLH